MVIKKIFEGVSDEEVHSDFVKFSRGFFRDKYVIEVKRQAKKWAIKTSPEFVNFLVERCLKKLPEDSKFPIKGVIVSTSDLSDEADFDVKKVSNFQGVKKMQIDTDVLPEDILKVMENYPRVFFALSFKGEDFDLKVKAKAPKSGKPGKEDGEGPKADFCSLKTNDEDLVKVLLFDLDLSSIKNVSVSHDIEIDNIVYPKDVVNLKPAEIREMAKRGGKVIRKINVDGRKKESEKEFVA